MSNFIAVQLAHINNTISPYLRHYQQFYELNYTTSAQWYSCLQLIYFICLAIVIVKMHYCYIFKETFRILEKMNVGNMSFHQIER